MVTTPKSSDCIAEFAPRNIGKKHDDLVALLQSTLAIGDYEDLFFMVLLELKFSPDDLDIVANCYDILIEDMYG